MPMNPFRRSLAAAARSAVAAPSAAVRRSAARFEPLENRRMMAAVHLSDLVATPDTTALPAIGTVPVGSTAPVGFSPAQIRGAYGITGTGAGQTIAIIVAYDNPKFVNTGSSSFSSSDLHVFDSKYGIADPPSFKKVSEYGSASYPSTDPNGGWDNETALDVEWTHAVAPSANILLVECNSASLDDLIATGVNYARSQSGVSVVTMSFAAGEASAETSYDTYFSTPSGHAGVTFVAASGDGGSPGGYPAYSPKVLSVGATTLAVSGNSYGSEVGRSKSGGGYSLYEAKPSFQNSVNSTSHRSSPDVSIDGDPTTGVSVYDSFNGGSSNGWYKVGGTSFSAPAWAGIVAEVDQTRAAGKAAAYDGSTGLLPRLYSVSGSDFHDVTSGNNGYAAGSGYDLVTGRGSPIAGSLIPALANVASPTPTPTPTKNGSISGYTYNDTNKDGHWETGESGVGGRTVYLDANKDGKLDDGEKSVTSSSYGLYTFGGLASGVTYVVRQVLPSGYVQVAPTAGAWTVALGSGQVVTEDNFGSYKGTTATPTPTPTATASVTGYTFDDLNKDGHWKTGEPVIGGRTLYVDANNDGKLDNGERSVTSSSGGIYTFSGLAAGTYLIREVIPSGSTLSEPSVGYFSVTLTTGEKVTEKNFGTHT